MSDPQADAYFCPPHLRRFVLIAAILASSMAFIDGSVISIAIPALRADLGATLAEAQWISNSYLLLLGALLLTGGAAGDRFGLRNVFGGGIVLFMLGSLACALSPNPALLIGSRVVQGLGAAFMVPGSLAIIAKAYPRAERGRAIGLWAAASSLTTLLGPVIGGLALTALGDWSWRLVFAINVPLGLAALALLWFRVPADTPAPHRRLDLPGAVLVSLGLLALAFGLTAEEGAGAIVDVQRVLLFGGSGVLLLLGFLWWESRAEAPMMPLRLFADRRFAGANGLTFALYFSLAAVLFYLPMALIAGWGVSPAEVAIALLPLGLCLTLMSPLSGRLADRFGAGPLIAGGSLLVALGFAGLALIMPLRSLWFGVVPMMVVFGVGMGFVVSPLSTAVMTGVEDADTGVASGVNNAVARIAGLFAVAIMGGVAAFVFHMMFVGGEASFGRVPGTPLPADLESQRVAATDGAFAAIAWVTAALALISAAIAWLTLERKLPART